MHYVEYLSKLVRNNKIDPINILTNDDLETVVRRAAKKRPSIEYGTPSDMYRTLLLKVYEACRN